MWTPEYFVRYIKLPAKVEGATVPNDDGTFDIYINSIFCEEKRAEILEHELRHIRKDHFYNDILPVCGMEKEANGGSLADQMDNVFVHPPGVIPMFNSLDIFRDYLHAIREQEPKGQTAGGRNK